MNIEQLNSFIEKKELLNQDAISDIMQMIEKYPYFQTAHMLLLKAMHTTQPEKFNGQLKISASFISDKKRLFQYIHSEIAQIKTEPIKKETTRIEKTEEITKSISTKVVEAEKSLKEKPIKEKEFSDKEKTEEKLVIEVKEKKIEQITIPEAEKTEDIKSDVEKVKIQDIKSDAEKVKIQDIKSDAEKLKIPEIEKILEKEKKIETINLPEKEKALEKNPIEEVKRIPLKERLAEREKKLESMKIAKKEEIIEKKEEPVIIKSPEKEIEKEKITETAKISEKEKTVVPEKIVAKEVIQEKSEEFSQFEKLVEAYDKLNAFDDFHKKKEIERAKIEPELSDEIQTTKTTETKHKKIVTDFFHTPYQEKMEQEIPKKEEKIKTEPTIEEKKSTEKEKPEKIAELNIRKEIVIGKGSPEFKEIKEEKRRIFIPRKETVITEPIKTTEDENPVIEEKIINEPEEIVSSSAQIEETKEQKQEIVEESTNTDTMSSIFSKIRQIKKEMNIESVQNRETIDINPTIESSKIVRIKKSDDTKAGPKIIKESFIGFEQSQIKPQDLIDGTEVKTEKKEEAIITSKTETESNQSQEITAKDLLKKQVDEIEKQEKSEVKPEIQSEESKSAYSKLSEKLNQIRKKEEEAVIQETEKKKEEKSAIELIEEKLISEPIVETTSTLKSEESAADALLRRIAEKKRKIHEEKEKEEAEKKAVKVDDSHLTKEKIEIPEIKEVKDEVQTEQKLPVNNLEEETAMEEKPVDLIDTFIEKVDKLERIGSKESNLIGDVSEKSTLESEEFMTEPMADLFMMQKNYKKAIEIYNKLILKFPEKKTYFAIQIKKAESLIK